MRPRGSIEEQGRALGRLKEAFLECARIWGDEFNLEFLEEEYDELAADIEEERRGGDE